MDHPDNLSQDPNNMIINICPIAIVLDLHVSAL